MVGKSHLYDIHYVRQFAIQQFLHGNGTHLLATQAKITSQHSSTADIKSIISGSKKISPETTYQLLGTLLKIWMMIRFLATHKPTPINDFSTSDSIEKIIIESRQTLQHFKLPPHAPSTKYKCTSNFFVMDGTVKITFRVCGVEGCFNGVSGKKNTCNEHADYKKKREEYTGYNCVCAHMCMIDVFFFIRWNI